MNLSEKDKARFWSKVSIVNIDDCWNWAAGVDYDGYGSFSIKYSTYKAHRVSWVIANGEIEGKLMCLHKCDNRKCVNPAHLYLGTGGDNNLDREHRNPGSSGRQSTIGSKGIFEIRKLHGQGLRYFQIAKLYNISAEQVSRICRGLSGQHTIEVEETYGSLRAAKSTQETTT